MASLLNSDVAQQILGKITQDLTSSLHSDINILKSLGLNNKTFILQSSPALYQQLAQALDDEGWREDIMQDKLGPLLSTDTTYVLFQRRVAFPKLKGNKNKAAEAKKLKQDLADKKAKVQPALEKAIDRIASSET